MKHKALTSKIEIEIILIISSKKLFSVCAIKLQGTQKVCKCLKNYLLNSIASMNPIFPLNDMVDLHF